MNQVLTKFLIALISVCISSCGGGGYDGGVDRVEITQNAPGERVTLLDDSESGRAIGPEDAWKNRLVLIENAPEQRYIFVDDLGNELGDGIKIEDWEPGQEHTIVAVWDGTTEGGPSITFYVDGEPVATRSDRGASARYSIPLDHLERTHTIESATLR